MHHSFLMFFFSIFGLPTTFYHFCNHGSARDQAGRLRVCNTTDRTTDCVYNGFRACFTGTRDITENPPLRRYQRGRTIPYCAYLWLSPVSSTSRNRSNTASNKINRFSVEQFVWIKSDGESKLGFETVGSTEAKFLCRSIDFLVSAAVRQA